MPAWSRVVLLVTFAAVAALSPCADTGPARKKAQPSAQMSSATGCIDEKDSKYILVDDAKLQPIVDLQADGFPNDGFAKHLGQKVTVYGKGSKDGGRSIFIVRKITTISETCVSARPSQ